MRKPEIFLSQNQCEQRQDLPFLRSQAPLLADTSSPTAIRRVRSDNRRNFIVALSLGTSSSRFYLLHSPATRDRYKFLPRPPLVASSTHPLPPLLFSLPSVYVSSSGYKPHSNTLRYMSFLCTHVLWIVLEDFQSDLLLVEVDGSAREKMISAFIGTTGSLG